MATIPVGKIPPALLRDVLRDLPGDPSVIRGPGVGEDAAVLAPPRSASIVATADPITFAADQVPTYALRVNANDVYVTGGRPRYFLATVLLPEGTREEDVRRLFAEFAAAASELGVSIVGGHTEIVRGILAPIVSGHMIGFVRPDDLIRNDEAEAGDAIVLCGEIAVEGTAIMARAAAEACRRVLGPSGIAQATQLLRDPGICVGPTAEALFPVVKPRACHDPTDGGVRAAIAELAESAGCGVVLESDEVPVLPACRLLCKAFGLDPLGLIASGSLLCVVRAGDLTRALGALRSAGIPARRIGELREAGEGCVEVVEGRQRAFPTTFQDEIARFWRDVVSEQ